MTDNVDTGFTGIEEDHTTSGSGSDPYQHLKLEITDYLGDSSSLNTYINLGKHTFSTTAGTVSGAVGSETFAAGATSSGEADYTKDTSTGDDLLGAFLLNTYLDDDRDRLKGSSGFAEPGVDYSKFSQPPRVSAMRTGLTDGEDFYPLSTDDSTGHTYFSPTAREKITSNIPKYTGWRDHTEGHRITTTRGDKIEIIGGNYKLISLGRGGGTVSTDWSGGHSVHTLEAPGNVTSINWREVPTVSGDKGWQWVEETVKGNVIERFHGTTRVEHYGDEVITLIGASTTGAPTANTDRDDMGEFDRVDDSADEDNNWDARDGTIPTSRKRPKMVSRIWGASNYDEDNSASYIIDIDLAGTNDEDYVGAKPSFTADGTVSTEHWDSLYSRTGAAFNLVDFESGSWADAPDLVREVIVTNDLKNYVEANQIHERSRADYTLSYKCGPKMEGVFDWISATEEWDGHVFEQFTGVKTQVFIGMFLTTGIAAREEIFIGCECHVNVGLVWDVSLICLDVTIGDRCRWQVAHEDTRIATLRASLKDDKAHLAKLEKAALRYTASLNSKKA